MQSGGPDALSLINASLTQSTTTSEKKKSKQRSRDESQIQATNPNEKRKKRKRYDEGPSGSIPVGDGPSKEEKKQRKRDKGKDKETAPGSEPQISTGDLDASAQASTAALLSAIVAAATGASAELLNPLPPGQVDQQYPPLIPPTGQHPFVPFATMPVGYGGVYTPPTPDPSSFSNNMGLPFSDLSFGSNEDVLRVLQDLDISKIASVLKALGDATAANLAPYVPPPVFYPLTPPALSQAPAPSNTILGIPPKKGTGARELDTNPMISEPIENPDHATLLATRWLNAAKLAELVETQGLVYRKGKFSAIEEQYLRSAIAKFKEDHAYTDEQLQDIIFPKNEPNRKDMSFWSAITAAVPQRPIIAVYHHVRRTYHPLKQQGKWSPDEDAKLKQAVADLGQQWEKVSIRVGRMSSDCRDRYRNHILNRDIRVTGPWSKEEEEQLTRIVTEMTVKQGKDPDNDVFWGRVSELMGGKRGRQQCRIKWTDALSKTLKNEGMKPRWSQQDAFILVHKVDSMNVRDDTEIDWKTLSDPDWNLWSAHTLQRRWLTMKRSIKEYENMTHAEIMDILRLKKAHLPLLPSQCTKKRKERKVMSAAAIPDAETLNGAGVTRPGCENALLDSCSRSGEDVDSSSIDSSSD